MEALPMHRYAHLLVLGFVVACGGSEDPTPGEAASGGQGAAAGTPSGAGASGSGGAATSGTSAGGGASKPPVDASCALPGAAFCDAFAKPSPGGRAGDLDDAQWSMARLGFGCGADSFSFPKSPINVCGSWSTVAPGGPDSVFCVNEDNDPRWAEGFHDNTSFNYLSARIRQPFDFAGRTGIVQWEADARTSGSHGWWVETWITEEPLPGANLHIDQLVTSKNAVGIVLSLNCGAPSPVDSTAGSGKVGVAEIVVVQDWIYTQAYDPFAGPQANARCVGTEQGSLNTLQFHISQNRVEVWSSHAGGTELERIAEADVDLPFSRGYVGISHVHYNAEKAEVTSFQGYQWARAAFDGPQLTPPRAYQIPDSLSVTGSTDCPEPEAYRISYGVTDGTAYDLGEGIESPKPLVFADVDPAGGVGARLNFNTTYVAAGDTLRFRFNGGAWHDWVVPAINTTWERQGFSIPVPVEDLVTGDNTLELDTNSVPFNMPLGSMQVANIDLEIELP
jgi:hypothetical protein